MELRNIIFDYSGTIDTNGICWGSLMWHFFRKNSIEVTEQQLYEAYLYADHIFENYKMIGPKDTFKKFLSEKVRLMLNWLHDGGCTNLSPDKLIKVRKKIVNDMHVFAKRAIAANIYVLNALKANGCKLALIGYTYGNMKTVLKEMRLADIFDVVIETPVFKAKNPDPELLKYAAERLEATGANTILVVSDSLHNDIIPASELGFKTAWIQDQKTTSSVTMFEKKNSKSELAIPTVTISRLSQIIEFVESTNTNKNGK